MKEHTKEVTKVKPGGKGQGKQKKLKEGKDVMRRKSTNQSQQHKIRLKVHKRAIRQQLNI